MFKDSKIGTKVALIGGFVTLAGIVANLITDGRNAVDLDDDNDDEFFDAENFEEVEEEK